MGLPINIEELIKGNIIEWIEIISFEGPMPPVDNEMLKQDKIVTKKYRNSRIGDFLKELHMTEGRGTGIPKIRKFMRNNESEEPLFQTDNDRLYFLTVLKNKYPELNEPLDGTLTDPVNRPNQPTQSTDPVIRLLELLQEGEKSSQELRTILGLKHRPTFRENYLHPAFKKDFIEYTIPEKPGSRLQKYRLTQKGIEYLKRILKK